METLIDAYMQGRENGGKLPANFWDQHHKDVQQDGCGDDATWLAHMGHHHLSNGLDLCLQQIEEFVGGYVVGIAAH